MIYLKSFVAGLVALLIFLVCSPVIMLVVGVVIARLKGAFDWNLVTALKQPSSWAVPAVVFALGFFWKYRRLKRARPA